MIVQYLPYFVSRRVLKPRPASPTNPAPSRSRVDGSGTRRPGRQLTPSKPSHVPASDWPSVVPKASDWPSVVPKENVTPSTKTELLKFGMPVMLKATVSVKYGLLPGSVSELSASL